MDNHLFQILAVDDDPGVLASLRTIFEETYHFASAQDARMALELLNKLDIVNHFR